MKSKLPFHFQDIFGKLTSLQRTIETFESLNEKNAQSRCFLCSIPQTLQELLFFTAGFVPHAVNGLRFLLIWALQCSLSK